MRITERCLLLWVHKEHTTTNGWLLRRLLKPDQQRTCMVTTLSLASQHQSMELTTSFTCW